MSRIRTTTLAIAMLLLPIGPALAQQGSTSIVYALAPLLLLSLALLPIKVVVTAQSVGAHAVLWSVPVCLGMLCCLYLVLPFGFLGAPLDPDRFTLSLILICSVLFLVGYVVDLVIFFLLGWRFGVLRLARASALGNAIVFGSIAAFGIVLWHLSRATYEVIVFWAKLLAQAVMPYSPYMLLGR